MACLGKLEGPSISTLCAFLMPSINHIAPSISHMSHSDALLQCRHIQVPEAYYVCPESVKPVKSGAGHLFCEPAFLTYKVNTILVLICAIFSLSHQPRAPQMSAFVVLITLLLFPGLGVCVSWPNCTVPYDWVDRTISSCLLPLTTDGIVFPVI